MGRKPSGSKLVEGIEGSELAKARVGAILERVKEIERVKDPPRIRPYGGEWQEGRREVEKDIREEVVKYQEKAREAGLDRPEAAGSLLLSPRTLRSWAEENPGADHEWMARGRPTHASALEKREEVFQALKDQGRETGVVRLLSPGYTTEYNGYDAYCTSLV